MYWGPQRMPDFSPVDYAIPVFIALILIELVWAKRRQPDSYEPRDTLTSLVLGTGSTVAGALFGGFVAVLAMGLYEQRLVTIGWVWWAWPLCFVLDDFAYYWAHRTGHRVRWFWASHVNHHSSQHYNLSTALRQSWTGFFALGFIFRIPLAFVGFHPAMILFVGAINLIYQFLIHTEAIGRLPRWFEAVMNTPSHHRVHHATNPRYLDANYAGTFIVWDRLFGTFVAEVDGEPIRYGIVKQLGSFNILWAVFHEWIGIARDVWRSPWRHKLSYIWRPPGWSHDGSRDTSDSIRARWLAGQSAAE
jgi:sterol desaturase/sphingolipid hydroxylase (fatty acid hydroxylase superfamily)